MRDHLVPSCCSVTKLYLTLCNPMDCSTLGSPVLHHLPGFAQIHVHWIGDAIQTSHPLSSPSPPALNVSQHQGLFQWVGSSPQVPKYWSFSISTASKYSGLISFRIDWFDLLAHQGTLKSLPQQHSLKASILWCSAFFTVQLSHPYMTTGETIAARVQLQQPGIHPEEVNGVGNETASHFPMDCLFIPSLRFPFILLQKH